MANEKVNEYLEKRKRKLEEEGKSTKVKSLPTTDGPAKGGSFGDADKVNAYLKKRQERIENSSYEKKLLERDRIVGKKVAERDTKYIRGAEEEKRLANRPNLADFRAAANRGKWSGGAEQSYNPLTRQAPATMPSFVKPLTDVQSYRDALNALPGMQTQRAAAPATEIAGNQSYKDALNALIRQDDARMAAEAQQQAFDVGKYLKSNLMAGWAGIGSGIMKSVNAAVEPLRDAAVDAVTGLGKMGWGPRMPQGTADLLKSDRALGPVYDWAVDPYEKAAAWAEYESRKGGQWAELGGQVIQSAVGNLPNVLLALMTGGGSVVGNQLAKGVGSQAMGGFGKAVIERAKEAATNPALHSSLVQMYGQRWEDARAGGADAYAATLAASITTLMNAVVEAGGGIEDLPFRPGNVLEWVKSSLEEGGEEVVQQVIDQLGQKAYVNKAIPWFSTTDREVVINPFAAAENMLVGSMAGALMSAPQTVANAVTGANVQEEESFPKGVLPYTSKMGIEILQDQNMLGLEEAKDKNGERTWGNYPRFTPEEQAAMQEEKRRQQQAAGQVQQPAGNDTSTISEADTIPAEGKIEAPTRTVSPAIARMAQEYGEDASIFASNYNGSDAAQYKRGFDAMFNAGKSGLSLEMLGGVSDQLTKGMSEVTKQSIYTAGRNRAANTITPGVQRLTTKKLGNNQKTQLMILDAIGKEYGLEIDVVDSIKDSNAVYRRGGRRIVVALDAAEGAYVQAAAHEAVHYIRSMDANGYEVLKDVVLKHLTGEDAKFDLDTAISKRMAQYAEHNRSLTEDDAIEEIVAEAVPAFFGDKEAVRAFVKENRTLAEKIRDFFVEFANKVREIAERYMVSQDRAEIAEILDKTEALKEIAQTFDLALRSAQEKQGAAKSDGEVMTARKRSKDADDLSKWTPDARFMEEVMTAAERGVFRTIMNDRKNLPAKKMPNGEYVIEAGRALVYTDGKITKPRIRQIVYFYTNDGTELDGAMDLWRRGEREGIEYERTRTIIENILGEESVVVYHNDDFREVQGEDDRGTGTNGRGFGEGDRGEVSADRGTKFSLKQESNQTDSEAFKKWFGDSKIVNADGTPKVMYHGTDAYKEFTIFKKGKRGWLGPGIYLSESPSVADSYAKKNGYDGRSYALYAKVEKPLIVTEGNPVPEILRAVSGSDRLYNSRSAKQTNDVHLITSADIKKLQAKGYDGIVWEFGKSPIEVSVFSPEQIKSATDNVGTFDPEDPDIRFSLKKTTYPTGEEAREAAEANRAQTQTEEFKEWFEGSVVVNEDGSPKIMYHGTSKSGFNWFRTQEGRYGLMGMGAYFTENPEVAQGYTRKGGGKTPGVYPVYLNIKNPIDMDAKAGGLAARWQEFFGEELDGRQLDGDMTNEEILRIVEDALMDAELPDYEAYDYFSQFYEDNGIDGITHKGGGRWGNGPRHRVYIALSGYQVKSATGNEGGFSGDEIDIRYSLKSDQQKAVREAQDEDWQRIQSGDVTVPDIKVDNETVRRQAAGALNKGLRDKLDRQIGMAANRILRDTESKYGRNELKEKLTELVKQYAANGYDTHTALMAEALANQIIDQSTRKVQSEAAEAYQEARRQLREAKITLTDTQRQEIENEYGSVNAYRRQVFGTVNVRNEGVTLESLWDELSGKHPEIFPPDTGEAQMPGVIAQFDQLMRPRYENIYGMDAEAAAHDLAMRIQGDVLGMIGAKNAAHDLYGTADKFRKQIRAEYDAEIRAQQKARVDEFQQIAGRLKAAKDQGDDEARKKLMTEYRKALKKVDARTAISEVRAANRVRNEQMNENRERAKLRDSIAKRANGLMNMLVKPEKGKHVPTKLQDSVLKVLEMLDINSERADYHGTETQKSKDYQGSVRWLRYFYDEVWDRQSKGETPEELDGLMMTLSERNIMDIRDAIDIFSLDGGVMVLRDMDSSQLKMVDTLLKTVKQSIESIGKLWRIQRYESIIQLGDASIAEMDSRGRQKITNKAAGAARDFFALDNMEPVSYGERLGEAGAAVIQSLMDGEKIKFGKVREASEATEKMLKEVGIRGYDIGRWRKHVQTVKLGGKDVRMTDAMLMSLYLTAKRPQGRQHLLANGMRIPTTDRTGAQVKTILLTEGDLTHAASLLTDKQRALADRMGKYLSTAVAKWGNDVTQRMYLYDAFTEANYWPITSDPNVLKTQEPEGERAFNAIVNAGFTKPVNQKATNAVIVMDAFDVFGNHIGEMASYAGYAEALTDALGWLNYKARNSETKLVEGSVKESMERLLGKGGIQYLTNLVQDINGARRGGDNVHLGWLMGNYKKAAVMGKIRVAIQQPTSIVRAAAEINPWYLIKAMRPTKGLPKGKSFFEWLKSNGTVEEMQKWSNLAWWKSNGNYDIGIGKGTDAILWGDTSIKDTVMEKIATQGGLVDPGKMDDLTWAHMWLAVKEEVRRKRSDLEVGSDEYFRAVAERFEYVMDRTQVVDTVMHRSQMMRGKDGLVKSLTSFMSEPTKSFNMLMRAVMNLGRNPKDAAAYRKLTRTTLAYVASAAATAAATALVDAFRYRDDEEKTLDYLIKGEFGKDWAEQWLKGFMSNVNVADNIPGVSTVIGAFKGEEATIMGFDTFADIKTAFDKLMNYFKGGNTKKLTLYGAVSPAVKAASEAFGLPFTGIMTNVETLGRIFDPKWAQSKSELHSMEAAYQALYKAMRDGDKQKVLSIRTELARGLYGAEPKSPKQIDTGIAHELARQDERVMKAYEMKLAGNQTDKLVATRKAIMADGFTEAQVNAAINYCETLMKGETTSGEKDMNEQLEASLFKKADLFSAMRSGDSDDVMAVMDYLLENSEAADPEKSLKSAITEEFKQEYINLVSSGRTSEAQKLAKTLQGLGLYATDGKTNYYSDKKLAEWVEDWEKAQEED